MINVDYSTIKSAASVDECVRRCGAFLFVGIDGWIHIFNSHKVPAALLDLIHEYAYDIIDLLKVRCAV